MTDNLPPLPELGPEWTPYWTKKVHEQMQNYARAALAQAQSCVPAVKATDQRVTFDTWLRSVCLQAPPDHAQDLARSAWYASDKQASADCEAMAEEIERLQKALAFWMPDVPSTDHPLYKRVANDVYLLVGFDGPNPEPSAFELGHVVLAAIAQAQSCVPAVWKWVPIEPTAEMIDAAANADPERESVWAAYLSASPQPQPVQPSDNGTPGVWFVRKRERDGELQDCFVAAPDYQGLPYDAEILGDDEYRDGVARKLADCELIVAAVNARRSTPVAQPLKHADEQLGALKCALLAPKFGQTVISSAAYIELYEAAAPQPKD